MAIIYKISRTGTDQCYVGHTTEQPKRWWSHRNLLQSGRHHSPYLQSAWNKYGEAGFSFDVIEECLDEDRIAREQYWMDSLNSCFNCAPAAGSMLGYRFTDEQRARCGVHRIGFKETPEQTEARLAAQRQAFLDNPFVWITNGVENVRHPIAKSVPDGWHQGRVFSEEHSASILAASSGPRSPEVRAAIKAGHAETWDDPVKRRNMLETRRTFVWYTDGISSKRVHDDEQPPEGWWRGRVIVTGPDAKKSGRKLGSKRSEAEMAKFRATIAARAAARPPRPEPVKTPYIAGSEVWITDGAVNRKHPTTEPVPDGWSLGHTLTDEGRAANATAATKLLADGEASRRGKKAWEHGTASRASLMASRSAQCWITNGTEVMRQSTSKPIPDGWYRGRPGLYGRAAAKAAREANSDQNQPDLQLDL